MCCSGLQGCIFTAVSKNALKKPPVKKNVLFLIIVLVIPCLSIGQNVKMYLDSGNYYLKNKRYENAISVLNKCIDEDPDEMEAYAFRAFAYYHLEQYKTAMDDCNRALGFHEGYAEMYNLRGLCKDQLGNRQGACNDWQMSYLYGFSDSMRLIKELCSEEDLKAKPD